MPFGPLADTQWIAIPSQQRAVTLLEQTAALRGVMLLSGGTGVGKSTLVGRWVRQLETRLYTPVNSLTYAGQRIAGTKEGGKTKCDSGTRIARPIEGFMNPMRQRS